MDELQAGVEQSLAATPACALFHISLTPILKNCRVEVLKKDAARYIDQQDACASFEQIVHSQDQDPVNYSSVTIFMTTHQSVSSKLLGAWAPHAHAANAGSPSREARKGFLFRRESEVGGAKECRQIVYGTAALEQLKREFLKNAQVRELSSEEALQECLRAQVVPFWPAPTSGPSNRAAKPRRPRLLNVVQCWRRWVNFRPAPTIQ